MTKKAGYIIIFILYLILFFITYYVLYGCILIDDDLLCTLFPMGEGVYNFSIKDVINNPDHGFLFSGVMNVIAGNKIPLIFNLNIQDYHMSAGAFIRSMYVVIQVYIFSKILFVKKNGTLILKILAITLFYMSIFYILCKYAYDIAGWTAFVRMMLPLLIVSGVIYYLNYALAFEKELTRNQHTVLYVLMFLGGISGEIPIMFLTFLILLCLFIYKKRFLVKSSIIFFIGAIVTFTRKTFQTNVMSKLDINNISDFFEKKPVIFGDINNILNDFFKDVAVENIAPVLIIILFIILYLYGNKRLGIEKRQFLFLNVNFISIILSVFVLIVIGRTPEYYEADYWFSHHDTKTSINMLLLISCIVIFSFFYKYFESIKISVIVLLMNIVLFFSFRKVEVYREYKLTNFYEAMYCLKQDIRVRMLRNYQGNEAEKDYFICPNNYIYRQIKFREYEECHEIEKNYDEEIRFINLYKKYISLKPVKFNIEEKGI